MDTFRWGARYLLCGDQNQKSRFENTATGYRIVVPLGTGTGERGDYVVVDDPHSVDEAESEAERRSAVDWWNGSMATRVNDLANQVRAQMDMPATKEAIRDLSRRWSKAVAKLIEDKANGPAVIQELQHEMPGLIPVNPEGGKVARAHAVSPQIES